MILFAFPSATFNGADMGLSKHGTTLRSDAVSSNPAEKDLRYRAS